MPEKGYSLKPLSRVRRLKPRTSAAMAALFVLRTEDTRSGTHRGIMSRTFFTRPPSNSTPRAVCASMMPAMSFMNTGMKCTVDMKVKAYLYGTRNTLTSAFAISVSLVT